MGQTWVRYRHRKRPDIEFDVEASETADEWGLVTRPEPISGEPCFLIRTVRNHSHHEEIHQAAFTHMPAQEFNEVYERR